jgi:SAM-dependent methyltransferase
VNLVETVESLSHEFPSQVLRVCELCCGAGKAARGIEEGLPGKVAAFGVDLEPKLHAQGLPRERIFVADVNDMEMIPDESFHFAFAQNPFTSHCEFLREIDRVLVPNGMAIFDIEDWVNKVGDIVSDAEFARRLWVYRPPLGKVSEYYCPFQEFLGGLVKNLETPSDQTAVMSNLELVNFTYIKPTSPVIDG